MVWMLLRTVELLRAGELHRVGRASYGMDAP